MSEEKTPVKQAVNDERKWYVLYTRSRAEKKALSELCSIGIEAYVPLQKVLRFWKDRKKLVEVPLINSYVFVRVDRLERDKVFKCMHIIRYITFEGKPAAVPEKQMIDLKWMVSAEIPIEAVMKKFSPGENVKIAYGPLAGITGELVCVENEKRFLLRIDKIGYSLMAKISAAWLEKSK